MFFWDILEIGINANVQNINISIYKSDNGNEIKMYGKIIILIIFLLYDIK